MKTRRIYFNSIKEKVKLTCYFCDQHFKFTLLLRSFMKFFLDKLLMNIICLIHRIFFNCNYYFIHSVKILDTI